MIDSETRIAGGLLFDHLTSILSVSLTMQLLKYARKLVKVVFDEAPRTFNIYIEREIALYIIDVR
jgi:hypothetical protein